MSAASAESMTPELPKFDEAGFDAFVQQLDEPTWLGDSRKAAWSAFQAADWPNRTQEDWMRSDLRGFKLDKYALSASKPQADLSEAGIPVWLTEGVELAGSIQTLDGHTVVESLTQEYADKGVLFGDLSRLASEQPELVKEHLHSVVSTDEDRFAMLHTACWHGGQLLYVPRGVTLEKPFHVVAGLRDGGTDTGHTLIIVEEGASATFLYESNSNDASAQGLHCGGVEIIVKPGGNLRYVNLQDWGRGVWHFAHQKAQIHRDAAIQWTIAALGSKFSQVAQSVSLVGEGAHSQVNGVLFTQENQRLTYNTIQHHKAAHCRSDFLYKSALQDKSRTVWRGMIAVDPGAQKTDGYQRNDNLLLSDQARADSIPGLEILADDVRCTHGSTSGKVDEELIFYAQSRGFTRKEAVRMIVTGFFQQIFDRITIESVREALGLSIARQVREYS